MVPDFMRTPSPMRSLKTALFLGAVLATTSSAEPSKGEAHSEKAGDNPQHDELQNWLDAYEEGEVELPTEQQESNAPPPPPIEELDQALQPVVVTLLHRNDETPTRYEASGCGPKNERIELLDDGIAPDTTAGDLEYTSILPVCPLGVTTIQIYEHKNVVWSQDFDLISIGKDPAIRIKRTASSFSLDTSNPDDFHRAASHSQTHGSGVPEEQKPITLVESDTQNTKKAAEDLVYWVVLVGSFLLAIGAGFVLARNRNTPQQTGQNTPAIPSKDRLPQALLVVPSKLTKVHVSDPEKLRAMTQALARNHTNTGKVLLLSAPENQVLHRTALGEVQGLLQFKGEPPGIDEMIETVNSLRRELSVVLLENPGGIHLGVDSGDSLDLETLRRRCRVPLFIIEQHDPTSPRGDEAVYVPGDQGWSLKDKN